MGGNTAVSGEGEGHSGEGEGDIEHIAEAVVVMLDGVVLFGGMGIYVGFWGYGGSVVGLKLGYIGNSWPLEDD